MIFSIAFAYLETEREDNFSWCLDSLRLLMHGWHMPSVIATDIDITCMSAIDKIFFTSRHFLCRWHIRKNILAHCKKIFPKKERFDLMASWNLMVIVDSEGDFFRLWVG